MAITQTRMLTLLAISERLKNFLSLSQSQTSFIISSLSPDPSREELLSAIQSIQTLNASISIPSADIETLAIERAHFKANANRNERLARKARQRRGVPPNSPSSTAPTTLSPAPLHLSQPSPSPLSLSARKLSLNQTYEQFDMPPPYADPYDNSEPLLPEHDETT